MDQRNVKVIPQTVNGDNVVAFVHSSELKNMSKVDEAQLQGWYHQDPNANHLGLIQPITSAERINVPLLGSMLSTNAGRIEVDGVNGYFDYDLPVARDYTCTTVMDTSMDAECPGIDNGVFRLILSNEYTNGDVLTHDAYNNIDVVVSDLPVQPMGGGYCHWVKNLTKDKTKYYPNKLLVPGIEYFKIGHLGGEFSTQMSHIDLRSSMSYQRCRFQLGGWRGVETSYTWYGGDKSLSNMDFLTNDAIGMAVDQKLSELARTESGAFPDTVVIGTAAPGSGGRIRMNRVVDLVTYLALAELTKLENAQNMFQAGGTIADQNGVIRANEGYYHQLRRGWRRTYTSTDYFPPSILREVSAHIFKGNRNLRIDEREISIKAGFMAYNLIMKLFMNEFQNQVQWLMPLLGNSMLLPSSPIKGTNDALTLDTIRVARVFMPEVGYINLIHEPSLDVMPYTDRSAAGFYGDGYPRTSYSLLIEDITAASASNAFSNVPSSSNINISNPNSNVFYVVPKQGSLHWGYENGRWSSRTNTNIQSSSPKLAETFFCYSSSAVWVKNLDKSVLVELQNNNN